MYSLTNLPIRFYPQTTSSNDGGGVGGFVSGLFGKGAVANISKAISGGTNGKLSIVDSVKGPSIYIESSSSSDVETSDLGGGDTNAGAAGQQPKAGTRTIPLKRIGLVAADDAFLSTSCVGIIMYEKNRNFSDDDDRGTGNELLRFDVRSEVNSDEGASSETRDEILDKIMMMVQWEGRRKEGTSRDDSIDESEEGSSATKKENVASKLKHFAKREIEMKKQKRDREQKKSRYMKESGGLKYTAIAMANREIT